MHRNLEIVTDRQMHNQWFVGRQMHINPESVTDRQMNRLTDGPTNKQCHSIPQIYVYIYINKYINNK